MLCTERCTGLLPYVVEGGGALMCGARSGHVTRVAEEMGIQREALGARLIGELLPTLLEREREREGDKRRERRQ